MKNSFKNKFSAGDLVRIKSPAFFLGEKLKFVSLDRRVITYTTHTPLLLIEIQEETNSALVMIENKLGLFRLHWLNDHCVFLDKTKRLTHPSDLL